MRKDYVNVFKILLVNIYFKSQGTEGNTKKEKLGKMERKGKCDVWKKLGKNKNRENREGCEG